MAKRRVYELARELNMTNKELLDRLGELGIEVKNHMSSLEDDETGRIKDSLFGRKEKADIEDTRVRPNIIRRRRKPRKDEEPAGQEAAEAADAAEAKDAPREKAPEPPEPAPEKPADEKEPEPVSASESETEKRAAGKKKPAAAAKAKKPAEEAPQEPKEAAEASADTADALQAAEADASPAEQPEASAFAPETAASGMEAERAAAGAEETFPDAEAQDLEPAGKPGDMDAKAPEAPLVSEPAEEIGAGEAKEAEKAPSESVSPKEIGESAENGVEEKAAKEPAGKAKAPGVEVEAEAEAPAEKTTKTRKARKKPKSAPARIISLPEEPVVQETRPTPEQPAEKARKKSEKTRPQPSAAPEETVAPPDAKAPRKDAEDTRKGKRKKAEPADAAAGAAEKPKKGKKQAAFKRKEVVEGDALYDQRFGRVRKGRKKGKAAKPVTDKTQITIPKAIKRRIKVDETIVLADLAKRMGIKGSELIKKLMGMGVMVTINQTIDYDTANLLAQEFDFEVERASFEEESVIKTHEDAPEDLRFRPPVVTIMGHVDHGKTSLLDVIRQSKVVDSEAGGITQHIGAYHVPHDTGDIVFLDTPGHEAFTAMRGRGAQVTDIVILVVAADDGVMPQTIEAIDHSRAAGVPIIVAVNKIDKPGAEPDRIKRELAEKGLVPEDWGGDAIFVNVSAKEQTGIDELLEMIVLQAEVLELKANPDKAARGFIIESRLETGRGPVATVLVAEGTLHIGEAVVAGMFHGKIRAMFDDKGNTIKEAGPSFPVEIIGLSGVPMAGDELVAVADEKDAKSVSEHRLQKQRSLDLAKTSRMSLDNLYEKMMEGEVKDLNLIIKADVQGSIEALKDSLTRLSTDEVKINIVHSATGTIHESDISLAAVSNAIILGFNVRPTGKVAQMAEEEHVSIRYYNIIYDAIKEIKDAMVGLMASTYEERIIGRAEVRQVFMVPNIGAIAGCMVIDGKIQRNQPVRIVRDGIVTHEGKISSLRRYKDDVKEVTHNYECGIGIEKYNDVKVGDIIECYYLEEVKPVLE